MAKHSDHVTRTRDNNVIKMPLDFNRFYFALVCVIVLRYANKTTRKATMMITTTATTTTTTTMAVNSMF